MPVAHSEEMCSSILRQMWQSKEGILINLVWVGGLKTGLGGKGKLRDTVIKFGWLLLLLLGGYYLLGY